MYEDDRQGQDTSGMGEEKEKRVGEGGMNQGGEGGEEGVESGEKEKEGEDEGQKEGEKPSGGY